MAIEIAAQRGWVHDWDAIEHRASVEWYPNDIGRFARPEEIAAAIVYLASTHATTSTMQPSVSTEEPWATCDPRPARWVLALKV